MPTHPATEPAAAWRDERPLQLSPILAHASDAFYENGFHGTTVREIARRVGVTVPALYYHHENKEAVLVALLDLITRSVLDRARAAEADAGDDPVARLSAVVESMVLGVTWQPRLAALTSEIRYLGPDTRARLGAVRDEVERLVLRIVHDGVSSGAFDVVDAVETVRAIVAMCQWISNWYQPGGRLAPAEMAEHYVGIALRAAGVAPADRP